MAMHAEWKQAKKKAEGYMSKWSNHWRADLPKFNKGLGKKLDQYEQVITKRNEERDKAVKLKRILESGISQDDAQKKIIPATVKTLAGLRKLDAAAKKLASETSTIVQKYLSEIDKSKSYSAEKEIRDKLKPINQLLKTFQTDIENLLVGKKEQVDAIRPLDDVVKQYAENKPKAELPQPKAVKKPAGLP